MSINTKTNCMKSLIMHVSDAASQMQIQPDFIVFSVCFHPPDCSYADRRCRPEGSVISGTRAASAIGHKPPSTRRWGRGGRGEGRIRRSELLVSQDYLLVFELRRLALTTLT